MPPLDLRPHPHLYQVSTRPWLHELGLRHGRAITLGSVPDEVWDELAGLGFDLLYLTGVWRRSAWGRYDSRTAPEHLESYDRALPGWGMDDVLGSPFAIQEYVPEEEIGGWEGLRAARGALDRRGIGLVLDFVPNHTATDHPWVRAHPERFVNVDRDRFVADPDAHLLLEAETTGAHRFLARGRDPYFPPWRDTAQLDHTRAETRAALIGTLRRIAENCDAVRCDMAMLLLNDVIGRTWGHLGVRPTADEFWAEAAAEVPDLVLIAEVYWGLEPVLRELGFHFTYDKTLYDRLLDGDASGVRAHLAAPADEQAGQVRFLENHDEARARSAFGDDRLPAAAVLHATLPGLRFYHHGQLEGRRTQLPVRLLRTAPEEPHAPTQERYERLLRLTADEDFHAGAWGLVDVGGHGSGSVVAHAWRRDGRARLIVANLGGEPAEAEVATEALDVAPQPSLHEELASDGPAPPSIHDGTVRLAVAPGDARVVTLS